MRSDLLTPQQWLANQPLAADEYLYVVMSNASDAAPMAAYFRVGTPDIPQAIWAGTPYASWRDAMPYVDRVAVASPLLDWITETPSQDWGWLAVSRRSPKEIFEHLRSLTQVRMPDGSEVFFRFWDGRQMLPILQHLGRASHEVLPVFERYWINGQAIGDGAGASRPALPFPWWHVPQTLIDALQQQDTGPWADNTLKWLLEDYPELYFAFAEPNLRIKVRDFVRHSAQPDITLSQRLVAHLEQEVLL